MKPCDFLDAMASVDETLTSASESAFYGYGKKENAPVNRRRLASASALILLLSVSLAAGLITASLFGVLPEKIYSGIGRGAGQSEQSVTIQLDEHALARDVRCFCSYSGSMSPEDSKTVLEIWNRYEHEKGVFDNAPGVFFRIQEDYEKGNFEFFSYDMSTGLMQYAKTLNAYDARNKKVEGGTYANISGEDMDRLYAIAEKYREELVLWTLSVDGSEYRMSDGDRHEFYLLWNRLADSQPPEYESKPGSAESCIRETCRITVNNSSYSPTFFRYYGDSGCVEYRYSGRNGKGEIQEYSEFRFAGDLKESLEELFRKYAETGGGGDSSGSRSPVEEAYDALVKAYPDSFAKIPVYCLMIKETESGESAGTSRFTFCVANHPTELSYVYDHETKQTRVETPELEAFIDCRMNEKEFSEVQRRLITQLRAQAGLGTGWEMSWKHSVNEEEGKIVLELVCVSGSCTVSETVFVRERINATKIVDGWTSKLFRVCPLSLDPAGDGQPSFSAGNEGWMPGDTGFLPIIVIRSAGELDAFINVYNSSLDLDHTYNFRGEESFTSARGNYGADFFEKNVLMLVLITAPSGGDRFRVRGLSRAEIGYSPETSSLLKLLYVEIEKTFSGATDNAGGWLAAIEADRSIYTGRMVSAYFVD